MTIFYWPCRVTHDGKGEHRVTPFNLEGCDGIGSSLEEATEAARTALLEYLKAQGRELIVPPIVALDEVELERGEVIRVEVNLSG